MYSAIDPGAVDIAVEFSVTLRGGREVYRGMIVVKEDGYGGLGDLEGVGVGEGLADEGQ